MSARREKIDNYDDFGIIFTLLTYTTTIDTAVMKYIGNIRIDNKSEMFSYLSRVKPNEIYRGVDQRRMKNQAICKYDKQADPERR